MQSRIIIFACFIYFVVCKPFWALLCRTFLESCMLLNGAIAAEKGPSPAAIVTGFTSRSWWQFHLSSTARCLFLNYLYRDVSLGGTSPMKCSCDSYWIHLPLLIPQYHFTTVMEHFLPWHQFTTVMGKFSILISFYYRNGKFSTFTWSFYYRDHGTFSSLISIYYRDGTFCSLISF